MHTPFSAIRAKLRTHALPDTIPLRARVIRAPGVTCAACDRALDGGPNWEMDFPGGVTVRLHAECELHWRAETGN